jgi:hypothetical protein
MSNEITVGSRVRSNVYVLGKRVPMQVGIVTEVRDGCCAVDIMSLHGGAPWVVWEATSHLTLEPAALRPYQGGESNG